MHQSWYYQIQQYDRLYHQPVELLHTAFDRYNPSRYRDYHPQRQYKSSASHLPYHRRILRNHLGCYVLEHNLQLFRFQHRQT